MDSKFPTPRPVPWRSGKSFCTVLWLAFGASISQSLSAILDLLRRKRVRAWNKLCVIASRNPRYYRCWTTIAEPALAEAFLRENSSTGRVVLPVCLVLNCERDYDAAARTIASIRAAFGCNVDIWTQGATFLECKTVPNGSQAILDEVLDAIFGRIASRELAVSWLLPLRAGDLLSPRCGQALTHALRRDAACEIIYWDIDDIRNGVRCNPWLKGEWDPLLYLARDSLSRSCVMLGKSTIEAARRLGRRTLDSEALSTLVMEIVTKDNAVAPSHIPLILTHCGSPDERIKQDRWAALVTRRWREPITLLQGNRSQRFFRFAPPAPETWPSVSIIIPTRDRADLLSACFAGLSRLEYPGAYDIIVVDNGTTEPEALRLLEGLQALGAIRVIRDEGPFNFAALNNRAAAQAESDLLCLLNNDVEALDGDWLAAMVRHAVRPDVGAVGGLLLYPDGSVQHAGVAIGIGGAAGHLARGAMPTNSEHFAWHGVTRTVSAVTAACLVVRRDAYISVGGLDAVAFAVAFNDVDFCLKLRQSGLRNVFVAEARLIHHESVSRGKDHAPANIARFNRELACFCERWGSAEHLDPHYSPLFSRSAEPCLLAF